jgi:hypothetical protein
LSKSDGPLTAGRERDHDFPARCGLIHEILAARLREAVAGRGELAVRRGRGEIDFLRIAARTAQRAWRYREAPVIGYRLKTSEGGETVLDLDKKNLGKNESYVDFMAVYRGQSKAFGGMNWRLQLNIRNLLNDRDFVPFEALSTGYVDRIVTVDRRLTQIMSGVDF